MGKKRVLIAIIACTIAAGIVTFTVSGRKPFRDLEASDIVSATVLLGPPDKVIQITDLKELVAYFNEVVIYNKYNSYTEYAGQTILFTLNMADGSQRKIAAFNPFVVIDGIGYKAKYKPCEELNRYANRLLSEKE